MDTESCAISWWLHLHTGQLLDYLTAHLQPVVVTFFTKEHDYLLAHNCVCVFMITGDGGVFLTTS